MKITELVCAAAWMVFACAAARADEITVVSDVLGPEGPLYVDGNLYYVGWVSNTLSKWDGKSQLRRWDRDIKGNTFAGGINDVMVAANGGAYATVFGPPEDVPTAVAGEILYLARGLALTA
jgi:gluconolactonase